MASSAHAFHPPCVNCARTRTAQVHMYHTRRHRHMHISCLISSSSNYCGIVLGRLNFEVCCHWRNSYVQCDGLPLPTRKLSFSAFPDPEMELAEGRDEEPQSRGTRTAAKSFRHSFSLERS